MKLGLGDVLTMTQGKLVSGSALLEINNVSIDSRTLKVGDLFIAIRGPRYDGHSYVSHAVNRGAAGVIVEEPMDLEPSVFQVKVLDTTRALQDLAQSIRERSNVAVVAVTGSMGKTTTKDAAAAAIGSCQDVLKSEGNLNNQYGLPLSLLSLSEEEVAVLEMGMTSSGEIKRLAEIAKPNVGVLTNISTVHLEFFDSISEIAEAKGELLEALSDNSVAVVNADDPLVLEQVRKFNGRKIRFGFTKDSDLRATQFSCSSDGIRFRAEEIGASVEVSSCLRGRHNVYNLLAGLAAARALDIPLQQAVTAVRELKPSPHRGERLAFANKVVLIDETYNSNPRALEYAIDALVDEPAGRKIAILGSMFELGVAAERMHREAGRYAATKGVEFLVGVGVLGRHIVEGAREAGMLDENLEVCDSATDVPILLADRIDSDAVVLFKASRSVGLEHAVESLACTLREEFN